MKSEKGGASVVMLAITMALIAFSSALADMGAVMIAKARAQRGADLSALAGAHYGVAGSEVACNRVRSIASANSVDLVTCVLRGLVVEVRVKKDLGGMLARFGTLEASARAGPAGKI